MGDFVIKCMECKSECSHQIDFVKDILFCSNCGNSMPIIDLGSDYNEEDYENVWD